MTQQFGLQLLMRQDSIKAGEEQTDALRLALLASGTRSIEDLFPEYFPAKELALDADAPEDVLIDTDAALDFSAVAWEGAPTSAEEIAMLEQFFSDASEAPAYEAEDGGWV